jgi:hypothetical protein
VNYYNPRGQQTKITWRHFVEEREVTQKLTFYRIDTELNEDIALDEV